MTDLANREVHVVTVYRQGPPGPGGTPSDGLEVLPGGLVAVKVRDGLEVSADGVGIAPGGVTTDRLANNSVTEAKLAFLVATQDELDAAVASLTSAINGVSAGLAENVQDLVGTMLVAGDLVSLVYDDATGLLTIGAAVDAGDVTGLAEAVQDYIAATVVAGAGMSAAYDDGSGTLTLAVTAVDATQVTGLAEAARDAVGAALVAGTGLSVVVDDPGDTITVAVSGLTSAMLADFAEASQDVLGAALVGSATVNFTYDDASGTVTAAVLDSPALGGQSLAQVRDRATHTGDQNADTIADFSEAAQDAVGGILGDSSTLALDYDDVGPAISGTVLDSPLVGGFTPAQLRDRATHSGQQDASTISDFTPAVVAHNLSEFAPAEADLDLGGFRVTNAADPVGDDDLATRSYVDRARGVVKALVAAVNDVDVSSPGATIDGIALAGGHGVLLTAQADPTENGPWTWVGPFVPMVRHQQADTDAEVTSGLEVRVVAGTYAGTRWVLTTPDPIALGATPLTFVQDSGLSQLVAGAGLAKTGNTLSIAEGPGIQVDADGVSIGEGEVTGGGATGVGGMLAPATVHRNNIASGTITDVEIAAANKDGAAGTPSLRTLGHGAAQAFPGDTNPATRIPSGTYAEPATAGLLSARPAATTVGQRYLATDQFGGILYESTNGSTWTQVGAGVLEVDTKAVHANAIHLASTGSDSNTGTFSGLPVATLAQAITLAGSTPTRILVADSVTVPTNATVPETVALVFRRRGALKPSSGVTLTINGTVFGGRWRIFDRTSGGTVTFGATAPMDVTYPEWWGAVGNGTTTDQAALGAALTATAPCSATLTGRASAVYAVAAGVTMPANARWDWGGSTVKQVINTTASPVITLASGCRLSNGTFDANSLVTGTSVFGTGVSDVEVERIKCIDAARTQIAFQLLGASSKVVYRRCDVDGASIGFRIGGSSTRVKVLDGDIRQTKNGGIYVVTGGVGGPSPSEIEISGNTVRDLGAGGTSRTYIQVTGDPNAYCKNILITRNWCLGINKSYTDPVTPGTADQITFNYVDGIDVIGNVSMYGGDCGISGTLNNNVNIVGNYCAYTDSVGIIVGSISGPTNGATVTGNTCVNNAQSRMGDRPDWAATGITFWLAVGAVVMGNTLADSQAGPTANVSNKELTANVATLTTSAAHGLAVGRRIVVAGVDATFDGTHTVTAVTATTVSYAKTATDVASQAATGTVAFTATQRYGLCYKFSTDLRIGQNAFKGNLLGRILNDGGNVNCGPIFDDGIVIGVGGAQLKKHLTTVPVLDWPSIPAHSTSDLTTTVTGAVVGDKATAHPNSVLEAGLIVGFATVSAADTVTIRLANVTAGAIDPANRTWRVMVWGH